MKHARFALVLPLVLATAMPALAAEPKAPPYGLPQLERMDFNRLALTAGAPLFWRIDTENPGTIDPSELSILGGAERKKFVTTPKKEGQVPAFTKDFEKTYRQLVELRRQEAVRKELAAGRPTLVETDLASASDEDRAIVKSLSKAAAQIDALYEVQIGADGLMKKVGKGDLDAQALMRRNHGPWCESPAMQSDPFCNALPTFPERMVHPWPQDAKVDADYCAKIAAEPNAKELTDPFTIVRQTKKGLEATAYHKAYAKYVKGIAATLKATAKLVKNPDEAPFKAYLLAAAKGFETDDWEGADEAWSKMNGENSKFYLRIAPDETYWEPCQLKAGFHMSFAFIDKTSLELKAKFSALRKELEANLANLIGDPYKAREVAFELPEFIKIIVNAGDSRDAFGATVGQSLPNFGKVAAESRGRTVAMVNLYSDPDTQADMVKRDRSLFGDASFAYVKGDTAAENMATVLHEAAHNLGPYGSYEVDGKKPDAIFGGRVDAILEELKAQTAALYFVAFLKTKGMMDDQAARESYTSSIAWAFGHIARGMFTAEGQPKTYSQLSAIQVGELMAAGAIRWVPDATQGPDDKDQGRFELDFDKLPAAAEALMKQVGRIKATGDKAAAEALIAKHAGPDGQKAIHADVITDRVSRFPRTTFVYGLRLP